MKRFSHTCLNFCHNSYFSPIINIAVVWRASGTVGFVGPEVNWSWHFVLFYRSNQLMHTILWKLQ